MSGLPDEVLDLLAAHGPVKLVARHNGQVVHVQSAPLSRELFLLVPRSSTILSALDTAPGAELIADDPQGSYQIRIKGRAVAGRQASRESRRSELIFWVPEKANLQSFIAVRLHPEHLDFSKAPVGAAEERWRAAGPVPGGELPPLVSRWGRLGSFGMTGGIAVALATCWFWILVIADEPHKRMFLLVVMALSSTSLLVGSVLLAQVWAFSRWREGTGPEAAAKAPFGGATASTPRRPTMAAQAPATTAAPRVNGARPRYR